MDYSCIVFAQRPNTKAAPRFCLFTAPSGEISQWSTVPRLTPTEPNGVQRAKSDFKVKAITNFFRGDDRNTIPTAIVITLPEGSYELDGVDAEGGPGTITLQPADQGRIFVVDGQHRLIGAEAFAADAKLPVVAILDASDDERAFQFIVINNKVTKVPTDHIRALSINFTDIDGNQDLEARLHKARLSLSRNVGYVGLADDDANSPFAGIVLIPGKANDGGLRKVVPAAIESGIAYIQSKKLRQLSEDDAAFEFFCAIWTQIKAEWPTAFGGENKLLSKVGLVSMTRWITDQIDFLASYGDGPMNLGNADDVSRAVARVLRLQTPDFWSAEWTTTIADTKSVRDSIEEALRTIQQNMRDGEPWHSDVSLIRSRNSGA